MHAPLAVLASALALAAPPPPTVGGWIVPWDAAGGLRQLEAPGAALADVFLFAARLDDRGAPVLTPVTPGWNEIAARARAAGARVWLTVVNDKVSATGPPILKDADVVRELLADPERRRGHARAIVARAVALGVDGIDLDYENLPVSERDGFTELARELGAAARSAGLGLSITVQPKTGDSRSRGPGAMDWGALCRIADRVQPMLYNEHNASTGPGPVASVAFVERVMGYALTVCPKDKLAPVLKVSGMDWGPHDAVWVRFDQAQARVTSHAPRVRRERKSRVPWFVYTDGGGRHVVYFEDARSLAAKRDVLRARGIPRCVLWSLGSADPAAVGTPQKR